MQYIYTVYANILRVYILDTASRDKFASTLSFWPLDNAGRDTLRIRHAYAIQSVIQFFLYIKYFKFHNNKKYMRCICIKLGVVRS